MNHWPQEAETIMEERFGKDSVIALATQGTNGPGVLCERLLPRRMLLHYYIRAIPKNGANPPKPQSGPVW